MNRALVDRIAGALLYEGYLLYPYRPSVKNRHRWTFGGLYPPSYAEARGGSDASASQTQCLVRGGPGTILTVSARFLQLVSRRVGQFDRPPGDGTTAEAVPDRFVDALQVGDQVVHSWQEAVEREVSLGDSDLGDLVSRPRRVEFDFGPGCDRQPVRDPAGTIVGLVQREQRRIEGVVTLSTEAVGEGAFRVTVRIENRIPFEVVAPEDRDGALLHALVSTHAILGVECGEFVSLLDPPDPLRDLAAGCCNVGTWPVLVGDVGDVDTMLSSPIILYDYPRIAPESPGDLFDATEIDEILSLRILTLTDEEKRTMAALDDRGRALLERTEALAREQLLGLHGTFREFRPFAGEADHG